MSFCSCSLLTMFLVVFLLPLLSDFEQRREAGGVQSQDCQGDQGGGGQCREAGSPFVPAALAPPHSLIDAATLPPSPTTDVTLPDPVAPVLSSNQDEERGFVGCGQGGEKLPSPARLDHATSDCALTALPLQLVLCRLLLRLSWRGRRIVLNSYTVMMNLTLILSKMPRRKSRKRGSKY